MLRPSICKLGRLLDRVCQAVNCNPVNQEKNSFITFLWTLKIAERYTRTDTQLKHILFTCVVGVVIICTEPWLNRPPRLTAAEVLQAQDEVSWPNSIPASVFSPCV